jgi:hypothetical protein
MGEEWTPSVAGSPLVLDLVRIVAIGFALVRGAWARSFMAIACGALLAYGLAAFLLLAVVDATLAVVGALMAWMHVRSEP